MAFESLTEKLQNVFKKLRGKGRLTEEDVKIALKEVKMALLDLHIGGIRHLLHAHNTFHKSLSLKNRCMYHLFPIHAPIS